MSFRLCPLADLSNALVRSTSSKPSKALTMSFSRRETVIFLLAAGTVAKRSVRVKRRNSAMEACVPSTAATAGLPGIRKPVQPRLRAVWQNPRRIDLVWKPMNTSHCLSNN
eukprot:Lithocolla_globosa_v1_NODE_45_length_8054_cov_9.461981.p6 type:complete len:111 gc:universal NODE_45_length_8054_cov_9.461981:4294-4626(+)